MSYYEKEIKRVDQSTQITTNHFFTHRRTVQKERIVSIEKQIQIKLRKINRMKDYHKKASKSLSDINFVQITKPVFKNSVLNKAFKPYQSKQIQIETKMKRSLSHSYMNTNTKPKSRNQVFKNIPSKRIYCINGNHINSNFDNNSVCSQFRGGWYKDNTLKVRSLFNTKTRNSINICNDKSLPTIEINTMINKSIQCN